MHVRTLIADNSRAFLAGARRWIAECPGLDLVGAVHRGTEVLETVRRLKPDLVLMDVILPEIDGLEATRRIKSCQGAPWVVIVTFEQGSPLREAARSAGADGLIEKCDFVVELEPLVRKLVAARKAEAEPDETLIGS